MILLNNQIPAADFFTPTELIIQDETALQLECKVIFFKPKKPPNTFLTMVVESLFPFIFPRDFHAQIFETDPYNLYVGQFSVGENQQIAALKSLTQRICD